MKSMMPYGITGLERVNKIQLMTKYHTATCYGTGLSFSGSLLE